MILEAPKYEFADPCPPSMRHVRIGKNKLNPLDARLSPLIGRDASVCRALPADWSRYAALTERGSMIGRGI